jgi:hypothetical protein
MALKTKNLFISEQIFSGSDGRCSTCYNPVLIPPGTQPNEAKQMIKDYLETGKDPEFPFG